MDDIQQLSAQMALIERQGEALKQNIEMLQAHLRELLVAKETIASIKDAADGQQVLFPIGGGCYVFASVEDKEKLIVSIGSNIARDAPPEKALEVMEKRIEDTNKLLGDSTKAYRNLQMRMQDLDQRGRDLMQKSSAQKL
jgi:prefoldin alpha subunit